MNKYNEEYGKFCDCCGRLGTEIFKELDQQPIIDRKQEINGHKKFIGKTYFYSNSNRINNCCNCGHKLKDQDINSHSEFMGMFGYCQTCQNIVTGYKCSHCGKTEVF